MQTSTEPAVGVCAETDGGNEWEMSQQKCWDIATSTDLTKSIF